MLFTIAIPTYNNAKTVSKAIESAINQKYTEEYEILVINNASTDNTKEVLSKYERNSIVRIETNGSTVSLYANHNICLKEAKGDYVLFCHSDDKLTQDALLILKSRIEKRLFPSKYILWGHSMFRDYQISVGEHRINTVFSGESSINCFTWGGLTPSGTCYSRRSILELGGFPEIDAKIPMSDWTILVIAAYNYFEFEMIDRLLFIREYASTANSLDDNVWHDSIEKTLDNLKKHINERQFNNFLSIIKEKNKGLFFWYKKYMSETELMQIKRDEKKKNRKNRVKRLIKLLLRW